MSSPDANGLNLLSESDAIDLHFSALNAIEIFYQVTHPVDGVHAHPRPSGMS